LHRQHLGHPQPGRRTYQAKRRAQLEHIWTLDVKHREFIVWHNPRGDREGDDESWGRDDLSRADGAEIEKADHELWLSHRVLAHAVEGYLLGCVEYRARPVRACSSRLPVQRI
jgi:hypothetical protein